MKERKTYRSQLRQEHTERTRDLIMEGLIRTMANGAVTWSIPDVAREAGISVPTVYRYFRTKQDLVQGLGDYVVRKAGLAAMKPPQSPQELVSLVRQMYISSEGLSDAFRMASVSELVSEVRKESIPLRLRMTEARLIWNLSEASRLSTGDILVTQGTDPGWTPVFPLVSGLVLEVGGQLSHGAIVAREYGIPAVINVPGALHFIQDGQTIEVDGSCGRVYLDVAGSSS